MKLLLKAKTDIFFRNSVVIFLTRFFPVLAALLVQIYFSRNLAADVYGNYQNFWVHLFIFAAIASAGIHVLVITYPPEFLVSLIYRIGRRQYTYLLLWVLLACSFFTFLQYGKGFHPLLSFTFLLGHVVSAVSEAFLIAFRRLKPLLLINFVYSIFFCLLHYIVFVGVFSTSRLFGYLLALLLVKVAALTFIAHTYVASNRSTKTNFNTGPSGVRSLWLHLALYDFLQVFSRWIDKFMISLLLTEQLSGIYFNGTVDIPFLPIILGAVGSAALIQLAKRKDVDKPGYTLALAHRSSKLLSAVVYPVFFFLICFRYELFDTVFTDKFRAAVPIFFAACLVLPLRAYSFTTILQSRSKGRLINAGALLSLLVAFILVYPLYTVMQLAGIALSFTIATYAQAIFYLVYTARLLKVPVLSLFPYTDWLVKLIVFGLMFISIHYTFSLLFTAEISLILGSVVTLVAALLAVIWEIRKQPVADYGNDQK